MIDFATMGIFKFWIDNVPNLDHPWLDIYDAEINRDVCFVKIADVDHSMPLEIEGILENAVLKA